MADEKVMIELSKEEALVFFAWIVRFNELEGNIFEDQAEERVLWDIEAILEKTLAEPLASNYEELLDAARDCIRDT